MINIIRDTNRGAIAPHDIKGVALSGGVDSMALLSFLRNEQHPRWIKAFFFDHGTETSRKALEFVSDYCGSKEIPLAVGKIQDSKPKKDSWEEYWRDQRYGWLHQQEFIIATAHHLNDVAETYIWGMAHGHPRIIRYRKPKSKENDALIVRPLLLTPKDELYNWCHHHNVPYLEDETNQDVKYVRNRIRNNIMPQMLQVNPGFLKVMARKVEQKYKDGYY